MRKFLLVMVFLLLVLAGCNAPSTPAPQRERAPAGLAPLPLQENPVKALPQPDRYSTLRPALESIRDYFNR